MVIHLIHLPPEQEDMEPFRLTGSKWTTRSNSNMPTNRQIQDKNKRRTEMKATLLEKAHKARALTLETSSGAFSQENIHDLPHRKDGDALEGVSKLARRSSQVFRREAKRAFLSHSSRYRSPKKIAHQENRVKLPSLLSAAPSQIVATGQSLLNLTLPPLDSYHSTQSPLGPPESAPVQFSGPPSIWLPSLQYLPGWLPTSRPWKSSFSKRASHQPKHVHFNEGEAEAIKKDLEAHRSSWKRKPRLPRQRSNSRPPPGSLPPEGDPQKSHNTCVLRRLTQMQLNPSTDGTTTPPCQCHYAPIADPYHSCDSRCVMGTCGLRWRTQDGVSGSIEIVLKRA